jgi:hypothetical protein
MAPSAGVRLGDIAEGSIVKLLEDGTETEFVVAKHNYDTNNNATGRTLLVRRWYYDERVFHSSSSNKYENSDIDTWLNGTYKNLFDGSVKQAMGKTNIECVQNGNATLSDVYTISRSVFILSHLELGNEGTSAGTSSSCCLFGDSSMASMSGIQDIIQDFNPSETFNTSQWTRTPVKGSTSAVMVIKQKHTMNSLPASTLGVTNSTYSHPAFTFPSGALFDEETMLFNGKVVA